MATKAKTKKKPAVKSTAKKPAPKTKAAGSPKEKDTAGKLSTKTMAVYAALKRPDGVTIEELAKITNWQAHSVRGFLSTKKKKDSKFVLEKFTRTSDGKTAYKIDEAAVAGNE